MHQLKIYLNKERSCHQIITSQYPIANPAELALHILRGHYPTAQAQELNFGYEIM
jgi:hypothetical protein